MAQGLAYIEKWSQAVCELQLGATKQQGGTREIVYKAGGQTAMPYLFSEGAIPHRPLIAAEIFDSPDDDWPKTLKDDLGKLILNPLEWALTMIRDAGADLVCLKLQGSHPDFGNKPVGESKELVLSLLNEIKTPMVILGSGHSDKDNEILPVVSEATRGERLLFGDVVQENYKTLSAACMVDGHNIIAESPIDVNIAKQLNILISDLGMPLDRIAINPTIGALGYGLEYAYSIMERARSAALAGDKMLAMPFVCFVGQEAWGVKEARVAKADMPAWGEARERGIMWEVVTAMAMLQAGADILTMRHPEAIKIVRKAIEDLMSS